MLSARETRCLSTHNPPASKNMPQLPSYRKSHEGNINFISGNHLMNVTTSPAPYSNGPAPSITESQQSTIREAILILESLLRKTETFTSSDAVRQFCQLQFADKRDEHFGCMFLDNQHRLIAFEELFRGTIDGAAVYPRIVVRRALELNAAAVIFTHNHPSGLPEPSSADISITQKLKNSLNLIDVRTLDHIVVGREGTVSMAERGCL